MQGYLGKGIHTPMAQPGKGNSNSYGSESQFKLPKSEQVDVDNAVADRRELPGTGKQLTNLGIPWY